MKRFIFSLGLSFLFLSLGAQPQPGYYDSAVGKKNEALRTALFSIINPHTNIGYDGLWDVYKESDTTEDGKVWDMYSTCTWAHGQKLCGNQSEICDCYNREHSLPKSWWGGSKNEMYSDAFHLYPTDGRVNNFRSNMPFGECDGGTLVDNDKRSLGKIGNCTFPGYTGKVFEPDDEYKGDFARTYFYMSTCYKNRSFTSGEGSNVFQNGAELKPWAVNLFLKWHREDPVSEKEINRNNAVEKHQHNRNPFIDYPKLAEHIWGNLKDLPFTLDGDTEIPYLSSPKNGATVDFGTQAYLQSDSRLIQVKAVNLTGDLSINISGANASMFSATKTISKADAEAGYDLQIVFTAIEVGDKRAELTLSGGGISKITLPLKAHATDDFMALPATNITQNGFTANWNVSAGATGYTLDVYSLQNFGDTKNEILLQEDFLSNNTTDLPQNWSIGGFVKQEYEGLRMASGNSDGIVILPQLDMENTTVILTVNAKQYRDDDKSTIKVTLNGMEEAIWDMTKEYANYVAELSVLKNTIISLSAKAKNRVYIASLLLETKGSETNSISITGYPKEVGLVTNYTVAGLENDSVYYYTVLPTGNGASTSNAVKVHTGEIGTSITKPINEQPHWFTNSDVMYIYGLTAGANIQVFDFTGTPIYANPSVSSEIRITLPAKGMYILRIGRQGSFNTYKIMNN